MSGFAGFTMSDEILNFFYRGIAISIGGSLYLRLLVAPSSRAGGGTETNYSNYTRYQLPRDATVFSATPANGRLTNGIVLAFPTPASTGNGNLVAFDVVDTPSGAVNKIYNGGPVSPAKVVVVGTAPRFKAGALIFTF
jgi:hypothetical protein